MTVRSRSRRSFPGSSSAIIGLPFLESLGFRRFAKADTPSSTSAPNRMIFLGMGFGVTAESWYPDVKTTGYEYELPDVLSPLARHKQDITIFQNLEHANSKDGQFGSTFWLTGADRYAIPGRSFNNTVHSLNNCPTLITGGGAGFHHGRHLVME